MPAMNKFIGILSLLFSLIFGLPGLTKANTYFGNREIFELRIYHFSTAQQEANLDGFFKDALLPALHEERKAMRPWEYQYIN